MADFFSSIQKCLVGLEATQGAHYWARVIGSFGHKVRSIAPQFVKPFLRDKKAKIEFPFDVGTLLST